MAKTTKKTAKKAKQSNPVGRPAMFKSAGELQAKVDQYFIWIQGEYRTVEELDPITLDIRKWQECVRRPEPATITGLVLFLGFVNRQSLTDYQDYPDRPEFSDIIKKARSRVEHAYELSLDRDKPTGAIFALKNMGWKDRSEVAPVTPEGDALNFMPPVIQITVAPPPADDEN